MLQSIYCISIEDISNRNFSVKSLTEKFRLIVIEFFRLDYRPDFFSCEPVENFRFDLMYEIELLMFIMFNNRLKHRIKTTTYESSPRVLNDKKNGDQT